MFSLPLIKEDVITCTLSRKFIFLWTKFIPDFITSSYTEKFGEAKVITVQEMVNSNSVCPRCGGDGGVNGGCQKCDGKGWVESMKMKTREVVKLV